MKDHGIKKQRALQAYFSGRVQKLVVKHGKIVVGWDEVLVPGVHERHRDSVLAAGKRPQPGGKAGFPRNPFERLLFGSGMARGAHYAVDPLSGDAAIFLPKKSSEFWRRILMWAEYVNAENVTRGSGKKCGHRGAPLVPSEVRDRHPCTPAGFIGARLEWLGLAHKTYTANAAAASPVRHRRKSLPRCARSPIWFEPVKDYTREQTAPAQPTSATPMNRWWMPCRSKAIGPAFLANWWINTLPVLATTRHLRTACAPISRAGATTTHSFSACAALLLVRKSRPIAGSLRTRSRGTGRL